MRVGIVGHEGAKFTPETEAAARARIRELIKDPDTIVVSGHCHLGGIDIWAEEEAAALGRPTLIYPPQHLQWQPDGFKARNILIAEQSNVVHCLNIATYPPSYHGMHFNFCYHCQTSGHIKSGGCWTAKYAQKLGKPALWHLF